MKNKLVRNISLGLNVILIVLVASQLIPKKVVKEETLYLNGIILSNDKIEGTNDYLNVIELSNGDVWAYKSTEPKVQTNEAQNISKASHKKYPINTIVRIEPIKE